MDMNRTLFSLLDKALREIVESILRRTLFPPNVNVVTLSELHEAINRHVSVLKEEKKKAERAKEEVDLLRNIEFSLLDKVKEMECLATFYESFWEEKVPDFLKSKKDEIVDEYCQEIKNLEVEENDLNDLLKIENKSKTVKSKVEGLNKRAQELMKKYEESLIENIKAYFEREKVFVDKFRNNVVPKLQRTNTTVVQRLLDDLSTLYEATLTWIDDVLYEISTKKMLPESINQINRTLILERAQKIREELIREIKDLNEQETLILIELVKILSGKRVIWLALAEACELVAKNTSRNTDEIKNIMLNLSEKGFLTLSIGL